MTALRFNQERIKTDERTKPFLRKAVLLMQEMTKTEMSREAARVRYLKELGDSEGYPVFITPKTLCAILYCLKPDAFPLINGYVQEALRGLVGKVDKNPVSYIEAAKQLDGIISRLSPHVHHFSFIDRPLAMQSDLDEFKEQSLDCMFPDTDETTIVNKDYPLNQILFGPPGTGKTYHTAIKALEVLDPHCEALKSGDYTAIRARYDELVNEGRINFVTFHQSFSYEDFVEGIKAETEDGRVQYSIEDGVFKKVCDLASSKITSSESVTGNLVNRRIWKISLGNTLKGEDHIFDDCIENGYSLLGWGDDIDFTGCEKPKAIRKKLIAKGWKEDEISYPVSAINTFKNVIAKGDIVVVSDGNHKFRAIGEITGEYQVLGEESGAAYRQCRDTRWLRVYNPSRPREELFKKELSQMSLYELKDSTIKRDVLQQLLTDTSEISEHRPYVVVIDEINRGNISRIFGELITLLEPSKRAGAGEALTVTLPYSKRPFNVPENVYVIGTMNTADRSLAQLDIALRRRFEFVEMMPEASLLDGVEVEGISIKQLLNTINERIEALLDRDHTLGHSYFLPLKQNGANTLENLARIFEKQILPLLQEYFFEDWQRIHWVLNDHQKPEQYQFVWQSGHSKLTDLFGDKVGKQINDRRWRINLKAFSLAESYQQTIKKQTLVEPVAEKESEEYS